MRRRTLVIAAVALLAPFLVVSFALALTEIVWPTYHNDMERIGVNTAASHSPDASGSGNLALIWTFPRNDANVPANQPIIVDMGGPNTNLDLAKWLGTLDLPVDHPTNFYGPDDATQSGYYWIPAVSEEDVRRNKATEYKAKWIVPTGVPLADYQVQTWFPSSGGGKTNTSYARYTLIHGSERTTIKVYQKEGGQWVKLRDATFRLEAGDTIELTNIADDASPNVIVVADAISLVPPTGMEIYTSAAVGLADIDGSGNDQPAAWIGTVEGPGASMAEGIKDLGAVYCIRSYTGAGLGPTDPQAKGVGTAVWRFPRGGRYDLDPTSSAPRKARDRKPVEGPLGRIGSVGGVYSSPTLISTDSGPVIVFGGMDGQVYCLDASTGELIWKGPGVTMSETEAGASGGWKETPELPSDPGRYDAFGGTFVSANATAVGSDADTLTYDISRTNSDPGEDAGSGSSGAMYAVYAWLPGQAPGDPPRSRDAAYGITSYDPSTGGTKTVWVRVDQSDQSDVPPNVPKLEDPNVGRWVRLGGSYWNPEKVVISTESQIGDVTRVVEADAIMVVPDDIGAFSYSTPVTDGLRVFIGNTNGRVYAFRLSRPSSANRAAKLLWTYPPVQTRNPASNPDESAAAPFGSIVSSPAFRQGGDLIVSSMDGRVYAITDIGSSNPDVTLDWTYDANGGAAQDPLQTQAEAFSSSPAIYGSMVYIPSTGGRVHALDLAAADDASRKRWVYPDPAKKEPPLSPFRFSTPAVFNDGRIRIVCGATGGQVYSIVDNGDSASLDATFGTPNFYAPIQSSVAVDAPGGTPVNLYIGTLGTGDGEDGGIWWANARTGEPASPSGAPWQFAGYSYMGKVFSSPAIGNSYLYVGVGKGRLCAFSSTAFGGNWVGGGQSWQEGLDFRRARPVNPASSTQVDIFTADVYENTRKFFQELASLNLIGNGETISQLLARIGTDITNVDKLLVFADSDLETELLKGHKRAFNYPATGTSGGKREVYFEWGEDIYLIAWNLPALSDIDGGPDEDHNIWVGSSGPANSVRFRFTNSSAGSGGGGTGDPRNADYLFQYVVPNPDKPDETVKHCVALKKLEVRNEAPGPGWTISVEVRRKSAGQGAEPISEPIGVVPSLTGSPGNWEVDFGGQDPAKATRWTEQQIGINNPLAICDDQGIGVAWPPPALMNPDGTYQTNRYDPAAHFNGNGYIDSGSWQTLQPPRLYMGRTVHGTNSRQAQLLLMDRSAVGLRALVTHDADGNDIITRTGSLKSLRLQVSDLHWVPNQNYPVNVLPWDYPPFWDFGAYRSRLQRDYPDISRRNQKFQMQPAASSDPLNTTSIDPTAEKAELVPALPFDSNSLIIDYDKARLRADPVDAWTQVPLYQPANGPASGFNGPGYGTVAMAYLDTDNNGQFTGGDVIAGKPTSYVEPYRLFEVAVDVPEDYHMVIDHPLTIDIVGPDRAIAPHGLGIGLPREQMKDWFRTFSVRNLGNVNLTNMKIAKEMADQAGSRWWLRLTADNVNPFFPIYGSSIWSSFDGWDPAWGDISADPFVTTPAGAGNASRDFGYTLSKARVGDVNPTELSIPDSRKCEQWPDIVLPEIARKTGDPNSVEPILPSVSVFVPLTQPTGSYHELVPVFADFSNDNVLNLGAEPFTDPSFRLNVAVAEARMTGGATPGSALQIEGSPGLVFGDTQPTAWRDPVTGDIFLFWSSNRFETTSGSGGPAAPNKPWYIARAALRYDKKDNDTWEYHWRLALPTQWWEVPTGSADIRLPASPWPTPGPTGMMTDTVKHSAPWVAVDLDTVDPQKVRLFWQGQVDALNPITNKIDRESRIFYTVATAGKVSGDEESVYSFGRDLSLLKTGPKAIAYLPEGGKTEDMWLVWSGGEAGRWSIYGNLNISPVDGHDKNAWSPDVRFLTPSCLVSVAEPCPLHRRIAQMIGGKLGKADSFIDLVYTGTSKYDQSSDIILTRYKWTMDTAGLNWQTLRVDPVVMPRVFNEELLRDPKYNVYTSKDLAWIRPPSSGRQQADSPYVRVVFTDQVTVNGVTYPAGTVIGATDGSISNSGGNDEAGGVIRPEIDRATGIYTYSYAGKAAKVLGQMLVDYSAGIIRFTNPLPPKTKVYADYTPQAKRLTRGPEQDGAPFTFVEKTPMMASGKAGSRVPNPGLVLPSPTYDGPTPTDRMWLFWRKPTRSGAQASTIYYKTYRVSAPLPSPVELDKYGKPTKEVTLTNALGPCEISWDGRRIFFTALDERYPSMPGYPGPVTISYKPKGSDQEQTVGLDTLTWEVELRETALPTRQAVNEGQVTAFADPDVVPSKIWVFWSSTRAGESDLYYQTISPNFRALY